MGVEVVEVQEEVRDGIPSALQLSGIARASPPEGEASRNETRDLRARSALAEASECANDPLTMSTNAEDREVTRKIDTSDEHMMMSDTSLSDGLDENEDRASPWRGRERGRGFIPRLLHEEGLLDDRRF